jgi:hypothetical protein
MDERTGDLYGSVDEALRAGVPRRHIVELSGPPEAIRRVARRVRWAARDENSRRKARRKLQKASRRAHRRT